MPFSARDLAFFAAGAAACAGLLATSGRAQSGAGAPAAIAGVRQDVLLEAPLAQFPGKRITVFTGSFEPGARTPLHRHSGTELMVVLEGTGTMELPGRPSKALAPFTAHLVEPDAGADGFTHRAINGSSSAPLKTLVVVLHDDGAPPSSRLE
jgi:quercetin dioxygenase-like cupin family protein